MPTTDPAPPGAAGAAGGGVALVLPRAWLQAQAVHAGLAHGPAQPWLAHGPLVLQNGWRQRLALVGPLRAGPPRPLPARAHLDPPTPAPAASPPDGLCLLLLAPPGAQPPDHPAAGPLEAADAWEHWLHRHAPDFRLACASPRPALAALWLRGDGLARAALREHGRWQPVQRLQLSGARLAQVPLPWGLDADAHADGSHDWAPSPAAPPWDTAPAGSGTPSPPTPTARTLNHAHPGNGAEGGPADDHSASGADEAQADGYGPDRRHSRLAAALGPAVLSRLQRCGVVVVGAGRIGSMLAHGLARLGVARLLVIDPDDMELHNLDGDLPPLLEGRPKVEALSRFVRPILRPGATVDARRLPIASPVAGGLIGEADLVIACVDNDAARLWANAWALASHRNLLAITTGQHTDPATGQRLAAAELRLLPAGTGCLACLGGFAQARELMDQLQSPLPEPTPADVREQRAGSLRSWAGIAANLGLRMVEQLVAGDLDRALFRRLQETPDGGLQVQDSALPLPAPNQSCPFCTPLLGAGLAAVTPERVTALAQSALGANAARG